MNKSNYKPDQTCQVGKTGRIYQGGRTCLARLALFLCVILLVSFASGCTILSEIIKPMTTENRTSPSSSLSATRSIAAGTLVTQTQTAQTSLPGQKTAAASGLPGDAFRKQVTSLIIKGLNSVSREIVLDEALVGLKVPESKVDATIELVFDLFQAVYYSNPQFYFLTGQAGASYILQGSTNVSLQSLTLKPGFIDSVVALDTAGIKVRQAKLEQAAAVIAGNAKKQGAGALSQLLYVHDYLVRTIQYDLNALADLTLNRERSNAASALLDHLALCQGYASSFQLVAQQLGFEVLMPTGTAEGVNHAWNLVKIDGIFYHVDVTYDDPTPDGGDTAPVNHVHFLRSDAMMRETHVWIAANYPAVPTDGAQYYRENNLLAASRAELQGRIDRFIAGLPKVIVQAQQMEILYTGKDLPVVTDLENMLQVALVKANRSGQILYNRSVDKQVVLIEFLPN